MYSRSVLYMARESNSGSEPVWYYVICVRPGIKWLGFGKVRLMEQASRVYFTVINKHCNGSPFLCSFQSIVLSTKQATIQIRTNKDINPFIPSILRSMRDNRRISFLLQLWFTNNCNDPNVIIMLNIASWAFLLAFIKNFILHLNAFELLMHFELMLCEATCIFIIRLMLEIILIKILLSKTWIYVIFFQILGNHLEANQLSRKPRNNILGRIFISNLP